MACGWFHRIFFPPKLVDIGADGPPSNYASLAGSTQRIGFVKLRLEPPSSIQSWADCGLVFLNHEFLRVLGAIVWIVLCGLIETFLAELSDMRYSFTTGERNFQIVNYLLTTTIIYTVVAFLLQSPDWTTRWIILRRWLVIMGFLYVFRGITLVVTQLPSPLYDNCQPDPISVNGSPAARFSFLIDIIGGTAMTCTDNIFSGHTSVMMSCVMVWRIHSRIRRPFSWLAYLIVAAGLLMILFTRFHYTIDVLLAIYIVYTTWTIYMRCIQDASLRYMFGFSQHTTLDLFKSRIPTTNASAVYEYLTWQPHPLGKTWLMWFCIYADGLDIRLRAMGVFDERGQWQDCKKYAGTTDHPMTRIV
ncbi:PAP2 superfamily C-terminal-domain-containing protein [Phycomyces nitens]|nr:PAP2 superfamily C-terminal-domain-containing protein [Phycomyces nitens]